MMIKNVKELEKTLDLDSVQQVPFKRPHSAGEGTSTSRTAPATQASSTTTPGLDKGKGIMGAEEEAVIEKVAPSTEQQTEQQNELQRKEQTEQQQEQTPPPQTEALIAPILQTPAILFFLLFLDLLKTISCDLSALMSTSHVLHQTSISSALSCNLWMAIFGSVDLDRIAVSSA